nr:hypothetical protein [Tanacetum cinerariifolium]
MPRGGKARKNSRPRRGGRRLHRPPDDVLGEVVVLSDNDIVADEDRYSELTWAVRYIFLKKKNGYYLGFSWGGRECYKFGPVSLGIVKEKFPNLSFSATPGVIAIWVLLNWPMSISVSGDLNRLWRISLVERIFKTRLRVRKSTPATYS